MDKIRKQINLEEFRNRFNSEGVTIAKDISIPSGETILRDLENTLPLISVSNGKVLRYGTMLYILRRLKAILREMTVYQLCKRGEGVKLVTILDRTMTSIPNFFFAKRVSEPRQVKGRIVQETARVYFVEDANGTVTAYAIGLDDTTVYYVDGYYDLDNGIHIGQYIFEAEDYEFLFKKFSVTGDTETSQMITRAIYFYNYAECKKYEDNTLTGCTGTLRRGIIPLSIYLEQEAEDMGVFTSIIEPWVPYKKYYLGDKFVDDNGVVWTLTSARENEYIPVHPSLNAFFKEQEQSNSIYYREVTGSLPSDLMTNTAVTYYRKTSDGYELIKAVYSEDIPDGCWEKEHDASVTQYTAVTESRLNTFFKPDLDDYSKPFPFRLVWDKTKKEELTLKSAIEGGEGEPYDSVIPFDGAVRVYTSETETRFTFNGGTAIFSNGVLTINYNTTSEDIDYTEVYPAEYTLGYFSFTIDENDTEPTKQFRYLKIDFENGLAVGEKRKANIDVTIRRDGTESQNVPYYKEEALLGIQDINIDVNDLTIDRGKAAAYERHSILGEVSSMDDLENYRNGFFKMINDENS